MAQAQEQEVVEKFVKPWLAKSHPDAAIVILAGSFGRAMKQDSWQPIASSGLVKNPPAKHFHPQFKPPKAQP